MHIGAAYPQTPHAVRVAMSICGEPARLVQLVPNAFVVRMSSALDEIGADVGAVPDTGAPRPAGSTASQPSLSGIPVRVWAELGRARMPSAQIAVSCVQMDPVWYPMGLNPPLSVPSVRTP